MKNRLAGQACMYFPHPFGQTPDGLAFCCKPDWGPKLAAKVWIQIKAAMSEFAECDGQMLRPLHPGVPVGHGQDYDIPFAGKCRRYMVRRAFRVLPAFGPLRRPGFRFKPEVEPLQIEGPDAFFQAFNGYASSSRILDSVR